MMIINPNFLFVGVWAVTLFLFVLKLHPSIRDLDVGFLMLLLTCMTAVLVTGRYSKTPSGLAGVSGGVQQAGLARGVQIPVIIVWTVFLYQYTNEILYFRTVPLLSALGYGQQSYVSSNIVFRGYHILFFLSPVLFLTAHHLAKYLLTKRRRHLAVFLFLVAICIASLSRSLMVFIGLQSLFLVAHFYKFGVRRVLVSVAATLVLFALIFERFFYLRNAATINFNNVAQSSLLGRFTEGFRIVYEYMVTPTNNLQYSFVQGTYSYIEFVPSYVFRHFIPGTFRDAFFDGRWDFATVVLADESFNTYTFLSDYLFSFGIVGAVLACAVLGLIFRVTYAMYLRDPYRWVTINATLLTLIALSVFSTTLNSPMYIIICFVHYLSPIVWSKRPAALAKTPPIGI